MGEDGDAPARQGVVDTGDAGRLSPDAASVTVGTERFVASVERPFVFGRADGTGVVGLDVDDMGISAIAGSIEMAWGVWWVVNQSSKRPLMLEHPGGPPQLRIAPGHRYAVTTERVNVLVPGAIYTHVLEVVLPAAYASQLRTGTGRPTSGTLTGAPVDFSTRERDALTALCAGYLESFPLRREHPNTYEEAARLLGGQPWTGDRVRKAVERVRERFAKKQGVYFEGPQANYELAANLVSAGILTGEDLARLPGRRRA